MSRWEKRADMCRDEVEQRGEQRGRQEGAPQQQTAVTMNLLKSRKLTLADICAATGLDAGAVRLPAQPHGLPCETATGTFPDPPRYP